MEEQKSGTQLRAAQESAHFGQCDETAAKVDKCYCRIKTLLWLVALVLAMIIGGALGGYKVYTAGPSFLGLVPTHLGTHSYGAMVEALDKHARGELYWQERAIRAEKECEQYAHEVKMKDILARYEQVILGALENTTAK